MPGLSLHQEGPWQAPGLWVSGGKEANAVLGRVPPPLPLSGQTWSQALQLG